MLISHWSDLPLGVQSIQFKLRIPQRKPWAAMADETDSALALAQQTERLMVGVPPGSEEVHPPTPRTTSYVHSCNCASL